MNGTCVLFLKEFRNLTGFHQRISIKNRHYRMAERRSQGQEWVDVLSTKEGAEAIGVFAGQIMRCGSLTRTGAVGATVGCRWWQLVYAILVSLPFPPATLLEWKQGIHRSRAYDEMVEQARAVVRHVERSRYSSLYRLLYRNEAVLCDAESKEHDQEPCLRPMKTGWIATATKKRYYVCTHRAGVIGHYFVLEKHRGAWYILSSYGSEWVRVPLRIHRVSKEEIEALLNAPSNTTTVTDFFLRYFLEGGLPQRYSEDEPDHLRGRVIPLKEGIRRELEIVTREPFEVGYIEGMEETIRSFIHGMEGGQKPPLSARARRVKQRRGRRRRTIRRVRTNRNRTQRQRAK
jgi:hypothetical protein